MGQHVIIKDSSNGKVIAQVDLEQDVVMNEGNYYLPLGKIAMEDLVITERTYTCRYKGTCKWVDLVREYATIRNVAWVYTEVKPGYEHLKDRFGIAAHSFRGAVVELKEYDQPEDAACAL